MNFLLVCYSEIKNVLNLKTHSQCPLAGNQSTLVPITLWKKARFKSKEKSLPRIILNQFKIFRFRHHLWARFNTITLRLQERYNNNLNSLNISKMKSKKVKNIDHLGQTVKTNPKKKTSIWLSKLSKDWNLKQQWKKRKQDYVCFKQSRMLVRQIETGRWCFSFWCRTPMLWTSKQSSTRTLEFQES